MSKNVQSEIVIFSDKTLIFIGKSVQHRIQMTEIKKLQFVNRQKQWNLKRLGLYTFKQFQYTRMMFFVVVVVVGTFIFLNIL